MLARELARDASELQRYLPPQNAQAILYSGIIGGLLVAVTGFLFYFRSRHDENLRKRPTFITLLTSLATFLGAVSNISLSQIDNDMASCTIPLTLWCFNAVFLATSIWGRTRRLYFLYTAQQDRAKLTSQTLFASPEVRRNQLGQLSPKYTSEFDDVLFWRTVLVCVVLAVINTIFVLAFSPAFGIVPQTHCYLAFSIHYFEIMYEWVIIIVIYVFLVYWLWQARHCNDELGIKIDVQLNFLTTVIFIVFFAIWDPITYYYPHLYVILPSIQIPYVLSMAMHFISVIIPLWQSYKVDKRIGWLCGALVRKELPPFLASWGSNSCDVLIAENYYQRALRDKETMPKLRNYSAKLFAVENLCFLAEMLRINGNTSRTHSSSVSLADSVLLTIQNTLEPETLTREPPKTKFQHRL
ncbi:hypothetical protein SeMB42_g05353 [Synchytrium endobioticum]|uniref:RGS domain-containing protein n=1 Tax=Synchytrium endobioticum TaxID=286115 RepID=A0A507CRX4_9FUNG|nr:hypothetical protein SeMB42_g05353 [Synchytrium endobioticum]